MKLIFTFFMIPATVCATLCFLCGALVYSYTLGYHPLEDAQSIFSNLYFSLLHFSMAAGLLLSMLCFVYSCALALLGFIVKTWIGAGSAIGIAAFTFFLSNFLLNTVI